MEFEVVAEGPFAVPVGTVAQWPATLFTLSHWALRSKPVRPSINRVKCQRMTGSIPDRCRPTSGTEHPEYDPLYGAGVGAV